MVVFGGPGPQGAWLAGILQGPAELHQLAMPNAPRPS